jgi:aspartyl-tRNA(Asn)/glutamyl-tRNA(Gln) amidotransferase subunit B
MTSPYGDYELVVGLEVHAQLLTTTKAFCGCRTSFGDPPNTHTCPVCLGLPGALPNINASMVAMALLAGKALACELQRVNVFARKNYFYPDLPKGYQISQYEEPFARNGRLSFLVEGERKTVRIHRIHMEEDAGKTVHRSGSSSIVDLNRAGTPLVEIVSEPDIRSAAEAAEYLRTLRQILIYLGINDGNLEQGSFRCDANVSVRKIGTEPLGTRTELKNINSFRFVEDAIDIEAKRQVALLESGGRVTQETRGFNADRRETYLLRSKEGDAGYRYFPDPDLPSLVFDEAFLASVVLPELFEEKRARYVETLGLTDYAAGVMTSHPEIAKLFEATIALGEEPVRVANFIQAEVLRDAKLSGLSAAFPLTAAQLAELLSMVRAGTISGKQSKELYQAIANTGHAPSEIAKARGMSVNNDASALEGIAARIIAQNEKQATAYKAGKTNLLGFFVGQIMKETKGSADPAMVNDILKRLLS